MPPRLRGALASAAGPLLATLVACTRDAPPSPTLATVLPAAPACADMPGAPHPEDALAAFAQSGPHGIDVSHHNGPVAWRALKEAGLSYAFIKASEGTKVTDPAFAQHWAAAKACGIQRGAYHFLHPEEAPEAQARRFLGVLGSDPGELPPVLDVERGAAQGKAACEALEAQVRGFIEPVERALGVKVMIYSGHAFWIENLCDSRAFSSRPLWVAHYGTEAPKLFGGWSAWDYWQYTDHFRLARTDLDLDRARTAEVAP